MKTPHKSQSAAMNRAGELPDGEQFRSGNRCEICKCTDWCAEFGCWTLRECINSGQVSAAQVVAHAGAGELPIQPETYSEFRDRFVNGTGHPPNQRESWEAGYISGGCEEKQKTARIERNRDMWKAQCATQAAALAAERAEVARLWEALTVEREKVRRLTIAAHGVLANFDGLPSDDPARYAPLGLYFLRAALTAPGEKHD